ncbi:hypothetical protein C8R43DRAFT_58891 [Mycena crocata]|nr:hypothetical protein C8R43DRAFT_58891 [Mycena crocata]
MFAKLALPLIVVSAFVTSVFSSPVSIQEDNSVARRGHGRVSFNRWQGLESLDSFDSFYGVDNFSGFRRTQTLVATQDLVCHSRGIEIIQQRLAVLQEMAKRMITETICEVETQVIVFEQYYQSLGNFHGDLRRYSGHHAGYDRNIVSHFGKIYNSDGSFCDDDWNFTGRDIGREIAVVGKNNWNDETSHRSVDLAYYTSKNAFYSNHFSH